MENPSKVQHPWKRHCFQRPPCIDAVICITIVHDLSASLQGVAPVLINCDVHHIIRKKYVHFHTSLASRVRVVQGAVEVLKAFLEMPCHLPSVDHFIRKKSHENQRTLDPNHRKRCSLFYSSSLILDRPLLDFW